ncbi:MAG: ATP-binding protein [Candidatus Limnocylindrales bacterium]
MTGTASGGRPLVHEVDDAESRDTLNGLGPDRGSAHLPEPDDVALARFMAEAGRILGASLDVEATLCQIADLAVPQIADWCAIELLGPDGHLRPVATAHEDPAKVALVDELRRDYPPDPEEVTGAYEVVRQRRTMTAEVTPAMVQAAAIDERHGRLMAGLHLHAWMCVPMLVGERVLGTIAFAGAESGRSFGARHIAFAENLAGRAAAAIENARSFQTADRFRRILDTVVEPVFVIDPGDGRVRDVNKGALDLLAVPPDALVGRSLWAFIPDLASAEARRLVEPLVDDRLESRTVNLRLRPAIGPDVPVEVLLQRVDLPGEPVAIVAIARDVRDQMEIQARLQRLAEAEHVRAAELNAVIRAIGDGVVVCAADGRMTLVNPAAEALIGDDVERTYAGLLATLLVPDGDAPRLDRHDGPVAMASRTDPDRWIEIATYPVTPGDLGRGAQAEAIVVLRDVTKARQREAIRETFIGVLSHELRTPVTTIYGAAKVLARPDSTVDAATRRSLFEDIVIEAERLQRLVEDVVAMNRFGEEDGDLGHEPVLVQRIVPGVVASEEARWPAVRFVTTIPAGLPTVVADPVYVEQVLRNLLSNAAKYGAPGAAVQVVLESGGSDVSVRILDDGPGVRPEEVDRLFELFYRSPVTARTTGGAGIGLFVCARLVRAMGGRIWAHARPTGGSEFGFALKVMPEA